MEAVFATASLRRHAPPRTWNTFPKSESALAPLYKSLCWRNTHTRRPMSSRVASVTFYYDCTRCSKKSNNNLTRKIKHEGEGKTKTSTKAVYHSDNKYKQLQVYNIPGTISKLPVFIVRMVPRMILRTRYAVGNEYAIWRPVFWA